MSKPISFLDLPAAAYPLTIEYISVATKEVLETVTVPGPGAIEVPGRKRWGEPVGIRITPANDVPIEAGFEEVDE